MQKGSEQLEQAQPLPASLPAHPTLHASPTLSNQRPCSRPNTLSQAPRRSTPTSESLFSAQPPCLSGSQLKPLLGSIPTHLFPQTLTLMTWSPSSQQAPSLRPSLFMPVNRKNARHCAMYFSKLSQEAGFIGSILQMKKSRLSGSMKLVPK